MHKLAKHTIHFSFTLFLSIQCFAQKQDSILQDFNSMKSNLLWFHSRNMAGLQSFNSSQTSIIKAGYTKNTGDFVDYYQSNNSNNYFAHTESIIRLNTKLVLYGLVNYQNFTGQNMGGSSWIDPYNAPFNFVEKTNSNRGKKNKETYTLRAAGSIALSSKLQLGFNLDYRTINFAKHKDLRHKNKLLNLKLSSGIQYQLEHFDVGLSYYYNRNIEGIDFYFYGNTDQQYSQLIDYGNFYGYLESYDDLGNGYITGTKSKPLFYDAHGLATQVSLKQKENVQYFFELSYAKGDGYFGKQGANSITFSTHKKNTLSFQSAILVKNESTSHKLKFEFEQYTLSNFENIYKSISIPGRSDRIEYYGSNKTLSRKFTKASIEYDVFITTHNKQTKWHINALAFYSQTDQKTFLYPFYREQDINFHQFRVKANRNFFKKNRIYTAMFSLGYAEGYGTKNKDYTAGTPSPSTKEPFSSNFNLDHYFEYNTIPRINIEPGFKYGIKRNNKLLYTAIKYKFMYAVNPQYIIGNKHHVASITLGIEF